MARILAAKQPAAFLLENVKNLLSHDKGNTFRIIMQTLEQELGYCVDYRVIDARHFRPQHRERVIIVGFRTDVGFSFDQLRLPASGPVLRSILHPENGSELPTPYTDGAGRVLPKYTMSDRMWLCLKNHAARHQKSGNGFGYGLVTGDSVSRSLLSRYYKDGSEILVDRGPGKNPRRLTPRECARLMGFPERWQIPVSDTQAYQQFGNSVCVPVIAEVARIIIPLLAADNDRLHRSSLNAARYQPT